MTHEEALRPVLDNPHDDAPRMVYADWLDDHATQDETCQRCKGKKKVKDWGPYGYDYTWVECQDCPGAFRGNGYAERAEFIRVQCRLALPPWNSRDMIREDQLWKRLREHFRASLGSGWTVHSTQVRPPVEEDTIPAAIVSRGFVSALRLPTAAFVGAVCGRCQGRGYTRSGRGPDTDIQSTCSACKGAKRTEGVAAALFRLHPVTSVTLSDKRPERDTITSRVAWHMPWAGDVTGVNDLPKALFERLDGMTTSPTDAYNLGIAIYPTEAAALDALSAACVLYGRKQAENTERPTLVSCLAG